MVFTIQSFIFAVLSLLCILINGILLWNLISHPKLITTINMSLAILLGINATLGTFWLVASALHYSELRLFSCMLSFHTYIMFRSSTLTVLVASVFHRGIIVKRGGDISLLANRKTFIQNSGILIFILCFTWNLTLCISLMINPLFPDKFPLILLCLEDDLDSLKVPEDNLIKARLVDFAVCLLFLFSLISSHTRIYRFKQCHGASYFSNFRQNIATVNETLLAAYVKIGFIFLNLLAGFLCVLYIRSGNHFIIYQLFGSLTVVVDCILIPGSWIVSTRKSFPEFWPQTCLEIHSFIVPESETETRNKMASVKIPRCPYVDDRDLKEILEHDAMKLHNSRIIFVMQGPEAGCSHWNF
jgi:hypothetical protein